MITNRKFIIAFLICFVLYLLPEIFVNDALLFLSGGVIAGSIGELLKIENNVLIFSIWIVLIGVLVFSYLTIKLKWLKYLLLIAIAFTLNIIDNIFAFIPVFDMQNKDFAIFISYVVMFIEITLKSLALSWIYYKGNKE
ncbi:hypothetical protein [Flavobacterium croceum]|uniref:hypothetical protein n=1 Tax=Flavobacterium croceum TaxID=370975 RepID=UPI0024A8AC59|nr:hypothetical protein [Flavobacterium croceum]